MPPLPNEEKYLLRCWWRLMWRWNMDAPQFTLRFKFAHRIIWWRRKDEINAYYQSMYFGE